MILHCAKKSVKEGCRDRFEDLGKLKKTTMNVSEGDGSPEKFRIRYPL